MQVVQISTGSLVIHYLVIRQLSTRVTLKDSKVQILDKYDH